MASHISVWRPVVTNWLLTSHRSSTDQFIRVKVLFCFKGSTITLLPHKPYTTGAITTNALSLTSVVRPPPKKKIFEKLVLAERKHITDPLPGPPQFAYQANILVNEAFIMALLSILQHFYCLESTFFVLVLKPLRSILTQSTRAVLHLSRCSTNFLKGRKHQERRGGGADFHPFLVFPRNVHFSHCAFPCVTYDCASRDRDGFWDWAPRSTSFTNSATAMETLRFRPSFVRKKQKSQQQ